MSEPRDPLLGLINYEAEQALLGACLVDNRLVAAARTIIDDQHFADELHARIWHAIIRHVDQQRRADVVSLRHQFDQDHALESVGGAVYLVRMTHAIVSMLPSSIEDFARVIVDLWSRRAAIIAFRDAIERIQDPETAAASTLQDVRRGLGSLVAFDDGRLQTREQVAHRVVELLEHPPPRYSTGMPGLDRAMGGGLFAGKTYGIAARKKVGKTVLLGTISRNLDLAGVRHLFLAHEMTPEEIETRNMARELNVNPLAFLAAQPATSLMTAAAGIALSAGTNMIYGRATGATLDDVQAMLAEGIARYGIAGALIDYWQLIQGKRREETEEYHMRRVAEWICAFCRRNGIWAIISAQVNQDGNTRGGEGLRLAADQYYRLHRDRASYHGWLEMQETRYTPNQDVGSEAAGGLLLHSNGPWFEDVTMDPEIV